MRYLKVAVELTRKRLVWGKRERHADSVAKELDAMFLAWGCSLSVLDGSGDGIPDRLVGLQGVDRLVEYKSPKQALRPNQEAFVRLWRGRKPDLARTREDVMRIVGEMREQARRLAS